jgi:hypothetical protein
VSRLEDDLERTVPGTLGLVAAVAEAVGAPRCPFV